MAVLCLRFTVATAQHTDIKELRSLYYKSYREKEPAEQLYKLTASATDRNPVLYGYKAIASIMMCNHLYNPYTRLKYFYNGRNSLELAIKGNAASPELRYLRFAVQCHSPALLNYSGNIKEDKKVLLDYLKAADNVHADADLYRRISEYMSMSKELTDEERSWLRTIHKGGGPAVYKS